ncbi:MAG: hypothetical protein F4X87_06250 [Chloroflexi bacterium]|nr:hypothetical protein [Chloroflexota bacterium]
MSLLTTLLLTVNETLTAGNAIIAVSLLLFNLTRNLNNRVAKSSAVVLACVAVAYVADAFISLEPDNSAHEIASRLQWIGIAFIPAAMVHLSDALLATTGLPSRGRRKRGIRILYMVGAAVLLSAAFGDSLIAVVAAQDSVSIQAGAAFLVYLLYFLLANGFAFYNVQRARKRCLTQSSARRMAYLQIAFLTPALGIFPYSVLLKPGDEFSLFGLLVINTANVIIILMLFFLSYPLYFFGSDKPDRLVKRQLLDFLLRGPATGLIALAVVNFTTQASRILSLPGDAFTPPAVVAAVLLWQWFVSLALPYFEKFFIYRDEDDQQITQLQTLNDRVLTHTDLSQLIMATTEAICDYLRIDKAFVVSLDDAQAELVSAVGALSFGEDWLFNDRDLMRRVTQLRLEQPDASHVQWDGFALVPLYSGRARGNGTDALTIGVLGLLNTNGQLREELKAPGGYLEAYVGRLATSLDDMRLQAEMYNLLEGLLPQFQMTRSRAVQVEYRQSNALPPRFDALPERNELFEQVRAALRHYWGGSGITQSNMIMLRCVQSRMQDGDESPVNALRNLLEEAIDSLKPAGERKMMSPEWTLYNILQLRFLENRKVREVARRLSMSEADLYRKQRIAILAVTDLILNQEEALRDRQAETVR